jgi:hypothetical protein
MDKENVLYVHDGVFFDHKQWSHVIYRKNGWTGDYHIEQNKVDSERPVVHTLWYM